MLYRVALPFVAVGLMAAVLPAAAGAADQQALENMAQQLIALRARVDGLQDELQTEKQARDRRLASLAAQQADLEAARQRQALAIQELRGTLEEQTAAIKESGATSEALEPVVRSAIEGLQQQIRAGLPFKVEERLGALDELAQQVNSGVLPAEKAVNRLWAFYEDEFRLASENGLYRQTIDLDGERLADVARLGTVFLYFRTDDDQLGQAVATENGWRYAVVNGSEDRQRIARLFDALQKQIRSGYFELPAALPTVEVNP